jgi:hypothetical protein
MSSDFAWGIIVGLVVAAIEIFILKLWEYHKDIKGENK